MLKLFHILNYVVTSVDSSDVEITSAFEYANVLRTIWCFY